ncbi:hypothetical protein ACPCG0_10670 [Propionibacteriaceae bacterium Y1923]
MTNIPSPDPTRSPEFLQTWVRQPLTALTAVVAMVYGLGFPLNWWGETNTTLAMIGALVVGLLFVCSLLLAYNKSRTRA